MLLNIPQMPIGMEPIISKRIPLSMVQILTMTNYLPFMSSPVSEMTYTVSSGTLNSTIPYHTIHVIVVLETYSNG